MKNKKTSKTRHVAGGWTSESGRAASKAYWATQNYPASTSMKIRTDVVKAAQAKWPDCHERVAKCSEAILAKIGKTFLSRGQ